VRKLRPVSVLIYPAHAFDIGQQALYDAFSNEIRDRVVCQTESATTPLLRSIQDAVWREVTNA